MYSFLSSNCCQNMPNHRSLPPILGFDVSVGILPRKVVVCRNFILRAVTTFWVMSLVGIYPGRASSNLNLFAHKLSTQSRCLFLFDSEVIFKELIVFELKGERFLITSCLVVWLCCILYSHKKSSFPSGVACGASLASTSPPTSPLKHVFAGVTSGCPTAWPDWVTLI